MVWKLCVSWVKMQWLLLEYTEYWFSFGLIY